MSWACKHRVQVGEALDQLHRVCVSRLREVFAYHLDHRLARTAVTESRQTSRGQEGYTLTWK